MKRLTPNGSAERNSAGGKQRQCGTFCCNDCGAGAGNTLCLENQALLSWIQDVPGAHEARKWGREHP
eukprot:2728609-Amphidinium_carterae.1